jgi:putative membrane protein
MPEPDPRVYFAAERTLLAWVRTGTAVIGLGFVVARFGVFLRLVEAPGHGTQPHAFSAVVGTVIVLVGALCTALAGVQFALFFRGLAPAEKPRPAFSAGAAVLLAFALAAAGLLLSVYIQN